MPSLGLLMHIVFHAVASMHTKDRKWRALCKIEQFCGSSIGRVAYSLTPQSRAAHTAGRFRAVRSSDLSNLTSRFGTGVRY